MEVTGRRNLCFGVDWQECVRSPNNCCKAVHIFSRTMSMKALIVEEFGDSSKLKYSEVPKPEPAEGEVNKLVYFTFLPPKNCLGLCLFHVGQCWIILAVSIFWWSCNLSQNSGYFKGTIVIINLTVLRFS